MLLVTAFFYINNALMRLYNTFHIPELILKTNHNVLYLEKCIDKQYEET